MVAGLKPGIRKAIFISTPAQWHAHHDAPIKLDLFRRHLEQFAVQLAPYGVQLIHLQASDYDDQVRVLHDYCVKNGIKQLFANREPELNERKRDQQIEALGIRVQLFDSDTIAPKGQILNKQGDMFKSFTPFKRVWLSYIRQFGVECTSLPESSELGIPAVSHLQFGFAYPEAGSQCWPLSQVVLQQVLPDFFAHKLGRYSHQRDFPSMNGTSGLSPYLAIGAISPRWLAVQLIDRDPDILYNSEHPAFSWLNELIWRDFYKHLLHHFPYLIKGHCFKSEFAHLLWKNNQAEFEAWCSGRTGYPIVDAAMRQLIQTGWMHNRLRMIVASFLTKHLLIDWRWGERFFISSLIDGDFCANNGGWQWVAGTGCDAQPYFRIFNPVTQSEKFDPKGHFIRRYLPELADIPDKYIHFPHSYLSSHGLSAVYWPAIVEHKFARQRALKFYKR